MLASLEGRIDDVLIHVRWTTHRSSRPSVQGSRTVREAQIIQEALSRVRLRYVPGSGFTPDTARLMIERLQERMGAVEVLLEQMEEVPRNKWQVPVRDLSDTG